MFSRKAKYFMELAKNNSLNDAANSIYITPSAMSQGLSSFEKNMGHKLLEKKKQITIIQERH
ncbi:MULTISPECIES: LysR family transcriptional regulator [Serratia]|uniref:LysR family transcriptional regulator n=1 Tax=Serratia TaxID=613 RepID=UPI0011C8CC7F|nr:MULTISPECIES: LysR family transcriptional regulator [Serratia]MBJ2097434.1 LysR family transcriptional regulator [Serratia ureilytica]TXE66727.1 LysR family transcriptional regulator [Serratia nevei]